MLIPAESNSVGQLAIPEMLDTIDTRWKTIIGLCIERETTTFQVAHSFNRQRFKEVQRDTTPGEGIHVSLLKRSEKNLERVMPLNPQTSKRVIPMAIDAAIMRPLAQLGPMQFLAAYATHQRAEADYLESHPDEAVLIDRTRKYRVSKAAGVTTRLFKKRRYL